MISCASASLIQGGKLLAQTVVPVHREPRHVLVLDRPPVRILDVRIEPGDTTLFHTHESPILYVAIAVSPTVSQPLGGAWGRTPSASARRRATGGVTHNVEYGRQPLTHRVTNVGTGLYHLVAVLNHGAGDTDSTAAASAPGALEVDTRWFRSWRMTLPLRESIEWTRSPHALIGVLVSEGEVEVLRRNGERVLLRNPGAWFIQDADTEYLVRNRAGNAAQVVLVHAR